MAIRVAPGRAGRLWLRHRLETADRGADLLEHKLRILAEEERRLALRAELADRAWTDRARLAETWLLRAVLAGGQRGLRLASPVEPAAVTVTWTVSMGVRYPAAAIVRVPDRTPLATAGGAALVQAEAAYRDALDAAVRAAAAQAALRVVRVEVATTRQRVQGLRRHWIPALQEALAQVELELAEAEHAEGIRRRWVAERGSERHRTGERGFEQPEQVMAPPDGMGPAVRARQQGGCPGPRGGLG